MRKVCLNLVFICCEGKKKTSNSFVEDSVGYGTLWRTEMWQLSHVTCNP